MYRYIRYIITIHYKTYRIKGYFYFYFKRADVIVTYMAHDHNTLVQIRSPLIKGYSLIGKANHS